MIQPIKCYNNKCRFNDLDNPSHCVKPLTKIQECKDGKIEKRERSTSFYFNELLGNECQCNGRKTPRRSFCYGCWLKLPKDLKADMYTPMGHDYEKAYEAAVAYLTENDGI